MRPCPSCQSPISPKAYDCPSCGHPLRKPKRGFFGQIIKWALILFNIGMVIWLVQYLGVIGTALDESTSEAGQAGTAVGGMLGTGMLLIFWVLGDIILGLLTILTRPRK